MMKAKRKDISFLLLFLFFLIQGYNFHIFTTVGTVCISLGTIFICYKEYSYMKHWIKVLGSNDKYTNNTIIAIILCKVTEHWIFSKPSL